MPAFSVDSELLRYFADHADAFQILLCSPIQYNLGLIDGWQNATCEHMRNINRVQLTKYSKNIKY